MFDLSKYFKPDLIATQIHLDPEGNQTGLIIKIKNKGPGAYKPKTFHNKTATVRIQAALNVSDEYLKAHGAITLPILEADLSEALAPQESRWVYTKFALSFPVNKVLEMGGSWDIWVDALSNVAEMPKGEGQYNHFLFPNQL